MKKNITKRLCRAGVIAALYVALTYAFMPFAFGPLQIRPAEALCILPLFFPEAVPALWVGCMLSNFTSPYFFYDVVFGGLATLIAASLTYAVGKWIKKDLLRFSLGALAPVLLNAFIIPLIIVFFCNGGQGFESITVAYFTFVFSLFVSESVWVYGLGAPLYSLIKKRWSTIK